MAWFRVPLTCIGAFGAEPEEAFYDLDDDATAVLSVSPVDFQSDLGQSTVALVLAVDAPDGAWPPSERESCSRRIRT